MVEECKCWYRKEMARDMLNELLPIMNRETILLVAAKEEAEQGC